MARVEKKVMTLKEARRANLRSYKFIVDHGNNKKGDTKEMDKSTGAALVAHKIVEGVKN